MEFSTPSLTLVGAGPGDPDLITLKGLRAIRQAHVILYDALVSPDLLKEAPRGCKLIFVGKRKGKKEFSQAEINQLLVFYARRFCNVVRLKGGDPHVFGRGCEESEYVRKFGISVDVVPGISSSYAAPAAAGIPLTKRGVNESFWVIAGTISDGSVSKDLITAANSSATLVILMGFSHLEKIAKIICVTRGRAEPIAIVQNATLPTQKIVTGTAETIIALATESQVGSPAVIVVGNVVNYANVDYGALRYLEQ